MKRKYKKGLVFGCFDIPHYAHLKYIDKCLSYVQELNVGLMSDDFISKKKGHPRPFFDFSERRGMLRDFNRDLNVKFCDNDEQKALINSIKPDVILLPADDFDGRLSEILGYFDEIFFDIVKVDMSGSVSTTKILNRIKENI